jgi:hypothetical protein
MGADGWQWARTTNDMAQTPCNRRGRVAMGAGHTARHGHFSARRGRALPHEVNSVIGYIHNNEQEH